MIVIVGGGITGLAAAFELARRGVAFLLLESSPRLGGLIHTEHVDGFTIDAGPDSLLVQKPAAIQLCEELGLSGQLMATRPPRTAYVLRDGRLHALPSPSVLGIPTSLAALWRYDLLDWPARMRVALEPLIPEPASRRRIRRGVLQATVRRRHRRPDRRAAARRHPCGRHRAAVDALGVPRLDTHLRRADLRAGDEPHRGRRGDRRDPA